MNDFQDMSSSLLGGANVTAPLYELVSTVPGLGWLQDFISQWLKLDITTIAAALTILGTLSGVFQFAQAFAIKIYWYITRFFTASVSINARDKLNREVLNWMGAQVLTRQRARIVTARSEQINNDAFNYYTRLRRERVDYDDGKRKPIQYLPTFGSTWFFHQGNIFVVRRVSASGPGSPFFDNNVPNEFSSAPQGTEPLVIMCLGRSVDPIKRFLNTCRDFAEKQRDAYVTVRVSKSRFEDDSWETTILRPIRPIETVHFDEKLRADLVADIKQYLDPATRQFYNDRGIPYRRGYLLHGPAGTGKTSLSMALAGLFGLELYLLHMPSVRGDMELERLFTSLPPRCIVLLEDIDAVGIKKRDRRRRNRNTHGADNDDDDDDDVNVDELEINSWAGNYSMLTLSGLLNVLDGVSSQEGRIVLMTSNYADRLDRALVRPGRIDKMIYLGNINKRSSELMFMRMYGSSAPASSPSSPSTPSQEGGRSSMAAGELEKLALRFGNKVEPDTFTPAQLQGYLLGHSHDPRRAVEALDEWMKEETESMEEAKRRSHEVLLASKKRRQKNKRMDLMLADQYPARANERVPNGEVVTGPWAPALTPPVSAKLSPCENCGGGSSTQCENKADRETAVGVHEKKATSTDASV